MTRLNWKTKLVLPHVHLVPYRSSHVKTYSTWMQDPELRRLTGSESLTLEEELDNQLSWRDDPKKCTFVVLSPDGEMVGDVNVFVQDKIGEINVMIAEVGNHRAGMGSEAVKGMMWYGVNKLGLREFVAKIALDNTKSAGMFESKLSFVEESKSEEFQEVTLVWRAGDGETVEEKLDKTMNGIEPVEQPDEDEMIAMLKEHGNQAFEARDFLQALKFYDSAVDLDSYDEVLRGNRSAARLRTGELFGALCDASVCVKLAKDYVKGAHRLGNAWAALGYPEKAKEVYREATKAFPQHEAIFDQLAAKSKVAFTEQLTPPSIAALKIVPRALPIDSEIELGPFSGGETRRSIRFAAIVYIWEKLSGTERMAVFEECCRAGYADLSEAPTNLEAFGKAPTFFPGAATPDKLSKKFIKYADSLSKDDAVFGNVGGLVLLFEGASIDDRKITANVLLVLIEKV